MLTNKQVWEALQGSIKKWEGIVAGKIEDDGMDNCPLCQLFVSNKEQGFSCKGCPVAQYSEGFFCLGTPYEDWREATLFTRLPIPTKTKKHKLAARKMVKFLKMLDKHYFVKGV